MTVYSVSRCIDCPLLDDASVYEWGSYGCSVSTDVDDELKQVDVVFGVPGECPLLTGPVIVQYEEKTS